MQNRVNIQANMKLTEIQECSYGIPCNMISDGNYLVDNECIIAWHLYWRQS